MASRRILLLTVVAALTLPLLAGCNPPAPVAEPTIAAPQPTQTQSAEPAPVEPVFVAPTSCTGLLGATLEAEILADGHVLFSSTDGTGIYYPNDSHQEGGSPFSCWYGIDMVDLSTFELAAQGLTQQAHEGVVAVLDGGGFTKTVDGNVVTYTQVGGEGTGPAIVHVLRPDSWITGWSSFGGDTQLGILSGYVDVVGQQVYPAP